MDPSSLNLGAVPGAVLAVLRTLGDAGHSAYLVGGAVRDLLLGGPGHVAADWDVATSATPEAVTSAFPRVVPTGLAHGTVTVLTADGPVEVTTYRGEGGYTDGRRPDTVVFLEDVDADLARRDFTINALAWNPLTGDFRDPHGGLEDLRAGRVRAVGDPLERLAEDGLRSMRAVRFACVLEFSLDPDTEAAIPRRLSTFRQVAVERVQQELVKLLGARKPGWGLELLDRTRLRPEILPEVEATLQRQQALDAAPAEDLGVRLAVLLHDLGAEGAPAVLERLRFPKAVQRRVGLLVAEAGLWRTGPDDAEIRRCLARTGLAEAPALGALFRALATGRGGVEVTWAAAAADRLSAQAAARPPLEASDLALTSAEVMAHLGLGPGPEVGRALRRLLDRVLEDPGRNTPEALRALLDDWAADGGAA